ncbi:oxidized low-density lipoprotein receptor 1-like [Hypanus sabinus]|uniref:oxidized low-density lipoprotein receptor 1-like n=1 Tax=Hypanus sabinus TaxID=79690 RepID=UPI0028C483D0|nr:oxidized low-density lipoprotein receptor 1-like [Hypanus sabinus]
MNRTQRQCRLQVHELNSTLESTISEKSHLDLSRRTCLRNLSELNSNLFDLKRINSDHRHQFSEMETKYRSVNETKTQICELLTSRKGELTCPQNWIGNGDRCYFISSLEKPYDGAREHCSNFDARLLEINSKEEEEFVSISVGEESRTYWIGKCGDGNVASYVLYAMFYGSPNCSKCDSYSYIYNCKRKHRFICEKSAYLYPDIPEEIQALCQQPVGPTSVK